jgi:hypothetical protein
MSDQNTPYDPTAPEGEGQRGAGYVTKKDIRVIGIAMAVLAAILFPIYKLLERSSQSSRCLLNMKAMAAALNEYAEQHDDRFPPLMRTLLNGSPDLGETGLPYTWASDVSGFMNPRASFRCPTAAEPEVAYVEGRDGNRLPVTYGMYSPYGAFLRAIVNDPDQTILIAETSNFGALDTFNPQPFLDLEGNKIPFDGFVIGWNDSNFQPSESSSAATRLAFPNSADGQFKKDGPMRHDAGIHAIVISGAAAPALNPSQAKTEMRFGLPTGIWEAPPVSKRSLGR